MPPVQQPMIGTIATDPALEQVREFLFAKTDLAEVIGKGLRQSFDEVIDGPRTARYRIEQLEKTEKMNRPGFCRGSVI